MTSIGFDAYFVRHAHSAGNAGLATEDPTTIPLTDAGRAQAAELAESIAISPSVIVSSPFLRAQQTAEPLHERFPDAERLSLPIHEFTYLAPAAWRHTTAAQRRPAVDAFWSRGEPDYCDGEGAESFGQFFARVEACLDWLTKQPSAQVILVSHEMFIRAVIWRCLVPGRKQAVSRMQAFREWQLLAQIPNASVTRITCDPSGRVAIVSPFGLAIERGA